MEHLGEAEHNKLTKQMVISATLLGINIVQTIAEETLKKKPGLSLKDFTHMLDLYVKDMEQGK